MKALIGIDCATQPSKTGLALGIIEGGKIRIKECCVGSKKNPPSEIVAAWIQHYDTYIIALDAPLGWAQALVTSDNYNSRLATIILPV